MSQKIAVVGAGILGSWVAYDLQRNGFQVSLYNDGPACSLAAGGLLCPFSELDFAEPLIAELGMASLKKWEAFSQHEPSFYFRREGSLVVCHSQDVNQLQHFRHRLESLEMLDHGTAVRRENLAVLEPDLDPQFSEGYHFAQEGQLDPRAAWEAVKTAFLQEGGTLRERTPVVHIAPFEIRTPTETLSFDWVMDCRGWRAQSDLPELRGVRGERVTLHAPDVSLHRPIRLLHPHTPLYIAPLPGHRFIVGASCIESESEAPITVRTLLELLSGAYLINPKFAEASVEETWVAHRPALRDNLPRLFWEEGLTRINGLYRHGFLLSPALAEMVTAKLQSERTKWPELFNEKGSLPLCQYESA